MRRSIASRSDPLSFEVDRLREQEVCAIVFSVPKGSVESRDWQLISREPLDGFSGRRHGVRRIAVRPCLLPVGEKALGVGAEAASEAMLGLVVSLLELSVSVKHLSNRGLGIFRPTP